MQLEELGRLAIMQLRKERKEININNFRIYCFKIANFVNKCPKEALEKIKTGQAITKQNKYNLKTRHGIRL